MANPSFLSLITSFLLQALAYKNCPSETLIQPCSCQKDGDLILNCKNISSVNVLDEVFQRTGKIRFQGFELYNSEIQNIPATSSLQKYLRRVALTNCNLTTLFEVHPDPSNVLQTLSLQSVYFEEGFPWHQFQNLKSLKILFVNKVEIPNLDKTFSKNVNKDLTYLVMWKTNMVRLEDGVFSDFFKLKDVQIEDSNINTLKRIFFPRPAVIETFHFNGNLIESLPNDIFEDMLHLRSIGLSRNRLVQINGNVFGKVYEQLRMLTLSDNPINCDSNIRWMIERSKRPYVEGTCVTPKILHNRLIRSLKENDFIY